MITYIGPRLGHEVSCSDAQRARFTKKVHKPPLGVNVIDFELNGSLGISKTPKIHDALIEVFKFIRCVKKQVAFLHLF